MAAQKRVRCWRRLRYSVGRQMDLSDPVSATETIANRTLPSNFKASREAPKSLSAAERKNAPRSHHRADIDGLRAVAATVVLLFHFFPDLLSGGYIGVDVFFVISGLVVTSSILSELQTERFSIALFYMKRIRRLYPPILIVVTFCLMVAWAIYLRSDFETIGKEALLTLSYVLNFHLARGPGYFDTASSASPFLHFWSLAVEEQFYLLWPAVLLFAFSIKKLLATAALIMLGSFAAHVMLGGRFPELSFYMLPTRAWEFMAGAVIAIAARSVMATGSSNGSSFVQSALPLAGMAAIGIACIAYPANGSYTAMMALVPVLATVVILVAPTHHSTGLCSQAASSYGWACEAIRSICGTGRSSCSTRKFSGRPVRSGCRWHC